MTVSHHDPADHEVTSGIATNAVATETLPQNESNKDSPRKIKLVRPAHIYYKHKDFETQQQFLLDFGFVECKRTEKQVYYRGYSKEPFIYCLEQGNEDDFGGAAFVVDSYDDLVYASRTLPNASEIYELSDAPGKGSCVTFKDPVDGFPFHLVYGQSPAEEETALPELPFNYPTEKHRPGNRTIRFRKGPAPVHKLGHFGMCVTDFKKAFEFYTTRFNFIASDLVHDHDGNDVTAFNRLDLGSEPVDHHCFFFFQGPKSHVHHSSYETHDFDTQKLGHDWLRVKGYENCWGVGRHIMGSQIFDYWFDPARFIVEHYVDGDLVDNTEPTNRSLAAPDNLHVWGPDVPAGFLD